jgi:hypothetical protein
VATYAGLSGKIVFKFCCGGYTDLSEHRNFWPGGKSALNIRVIMWGKKLCHCRDANIQRYRMTTVYDSVTLSPYLDFVFRLNFFNTTFRKPALLSSSGKDARTKTTNKYTVSVSNNKAIPLRAWTGPESSRRLREVRLSALCTGRLYPPGNIPGTQFC